MKDNQNKIKEEKESVYLETTVISYYTSKLREDDIIVSAHQKITRQWWSIAIRRYNIFISDTVIDEVSSGDPDAAKRRLDEIKDFPRLEFNEDVEKLAQIYVDRLNIPEKSNLDAVHLAIACMNNIDYIVTWNCRHLANGEIIKKLIKINESLGVHMPIICTPEELTEV